MADACRAVGIARSVYYHKPCGQASLARAEEDANIRDLIEAIQAELPQYGARRLKNHLKEHYGLKISRPRIGRIMRENGLKALIWRGFKVKTTDSNHSYRIAPNLIAGTSVTEINQVWVTDITYIRIRYGFVYLAAVMDLYSRQIVGWAISKNIDTALCLWALYNAIEKRKPKAGLIHHSDRGVQYASDEYRQALVDNELIASMSAKGHCYDNAFMESFFKTLKAEEVYLTEYETIDDVMTNVPRFIEGVYNRKRIHSSLGYKSPVEFERLASKGKKMLEKLGVNPVLQIT